MISFEEAIERTLRGVTRLAVERVALERAADRVLAEKLRTDRPLPAFTYSAMDGYAVRCSHFEDAGPWTLQVRGESRAGKAGPAVAHGTAVRIFTGAPIPAGANAVIIQERVNRSGDQISIDKRPQEGQNVRPQGADLARGAVALAAGTRLTPARLGVAASLDRAHLLVARRPVVTIISTGDELRVPGMPATSSAGADGSHSIPESNSFVLAALCRRLGAAPRVMPMLADDPELTRTEIARALQGSDLLITIGGASVGDHDLVRPAMEALGVSIDFWGVAIKPGKPTASGCYGATKVLCLPGNPASCACTFLLFGAPLLRAMQGEPKPRPRRLPLRVIGSHVRRKAEREEYLRARLELHDGELCAVLPASQASGAVTSFAGAEALVVVAIGQKLVDNGDRVPAILLSDVWNP